MFRFALSIAFSVLLATSAVAEETAPEQPMTFDRMVEIVGGLDENSVVQGTRLFLTIADVPVVIITDPVADRMRAMVPIRAVEEMTPEEVIRVLQANFDTALDARYAIAQGRLWAVFIHPLSPLEKNQFISALGQTVNIARTYGTFYSGGALSYGGGDSEGILRGLIEDLLKKGEEI